MVKENRLDISIKEIMLGKWMVRTKALDPRRQTLLLRHPTLHEAMLCEFEYQEYLKEHQQELSSRKEIESIVLTKNIWSPSKDKAIGQLQQRLVELEKDSKELAERAKKAVGYKAQLRSVNSQIDHISTVLQKTIIERDSIFFNTLENQANNHQLRKIISLITEYPDGTSVWNGNLDNETDLDLIDLLVSEYCKKVNQLDVKSIREIARSGLWRIRWNVAKNSPKNLFNRSLCDISDEQFLLVYWSQVYDSVYEAYDPVPDEIIEDDEKLDRYLESRNEDRRSKNRREYYSKKFGKESGNEVFRVVDGYYNKDGNWVEYTQEEKDKIADSTYEANVPMLRQMQRKAFEKLNNKDGQFVAEEKLRDNVDFKVLGWDSIKK